MKLCISDVKLLLNGIKLIPSQVDIIKKKDDIKRTRPSKVNIKIGPRMEYTQLFAVCIHLLIIVLNFYNVDCGDKRL